MISLDQLTLSAATTSPPPAPTSYAVVEQDANHKVWQHVSWIPDPFGNYTPLTNSYTEIQTAMSHLVNGAWAASDPTLQTSPTGAQATNCAHSVSFLGDINSAGTVDLVMPDGNHLTSNILGLSYFDTASGQSIWIGQITNSTGEILPSGNEALYPDAFSGCLADVLYVNQVSRFEQIIVLRSQLPPCAQWGMNPATTLFGVVTEFLNPVQPTITEQTVDGSTDQHLDFGLMQMPRGEAFAIGSETNRISVTKQWLLLQGRRCLVEQVPLQQVVPLLQNLPPAGTASTAPSPGSLLYKLYANSAALHSRSDGGRPTNGVSRLADFPLPARKAVRHDTPPLKIAHAQPRVKGLALDYTLLNNQTNPFTFQGDSVYYVSGTVTLSSTNNVIEGLAVIKFTNSPSATIIPSGLIWKTRPYAPVVFTSKNDDTVGLGDLITGSTGNPTTNFYGAIALDLSGISNPTVLNARFSYLSNAVKGSSMTLRDVQFNRCANALATGSTHAKIFNGLFYQIGTAIKANNGPLGEDDPILENVTAHYCTNFMGDSTGGISLTNCLFACVTNWECATTQTNSCAFLTSDSGIFQSVGGGGHYLADQSSYRNAGTANIDATLLADLAIKTTYPPIVYSNITLATDETFGPQAQRDSDTPDLGVHYDPLDFAFGGCTADGNLTFQPGTAAGWFRTTAGWEHAGQGIHMADTKIATFSGTVTAPTWWVRYNTVQEQATTNWSGGYGPGGITGWASYLTNSPEVHAFFLHCAVLGGEGGSGNHFRDDNGYLLVRARHSEFYGGGLGGYVCSQYQTNCLFDRTSIWLAGGQPNTTWFFRNATFHGGGFNINRYANPTPVTALDCSFDSTAVSTSDQYSGNSTITTYNFNAFITNDSRTTPNGANDILVTNFNWQTSWFGTYYLTSDSPLVNGDSTITADAVGLYQFTTQTNLSPPIVEGTSGLDLGYHFVPADANGNPPDNNGDGIPDYLENLTGDGNIDSGEIGWDLIGDLGLKVWITQPAPSGTVP
ncbi:MAG TPA: hypothetical protein VG167_01690 [Verrucomicrobiae bacterium]|nr:hypothetical protein [Verrucomicrobiae bacterium]